MVTRTHHRDTFYVECLYYSMLRSIAVHIHNVFCVPFNVCDNVQLCADKAILSVTAVLFDMRYHFSTRALRAQYQPRASPGTANT
jgi:hypothetical protein